jgi:hypothetical protein
MGQRQQESACGLCGLTFSIRPLHLRAFQNARALAKSGAVEALLGYLKADCVGNPDMGASVCSSLRRLVVNDEICTVGLRLFAVHTP